jgi:hypothetical protein
LINQTKKENIMTDEHEMHHIAKGRWVFYGFLLIAGFLLFTEHRAHVLGILPYLFLLACPLMHLFMHHGHGGHGHHAHNHDTTEGEGK